MMSLSNEVIQVAAKSLAASNLVTFFWTDERWLFRPKEVPHPLKKNPDSCQALFEFIE